MQKDLPEPVSTIEPMVAQSAGKALARAGTKPNRITKVQGKVRHLLVPRTAAAHRSRGHWLDYLVNLTLVLPAVAMLVYSLWFAGPIYTSYASFSIHGQEPSGGGKPGGGGLGGLMASLPGITDAFALQEFLISPDSLAAIDVDGSYRKQMQAPHGDVFTRLDADPTPDRLLAYYQSMIDVRFSTIEQIVSMKISAFTADDAQRTANRMIAVAEKFVNDLNERQRADLLKSSQREVDLAKQRVVDSRSAMTNWQSTHANFDPEQLTKTVQGIIGDLENEKSRINAELAQLQQVSPTHPRISQLQARLTALSTQLDSQRARLTSGNDSAAKETDQFERLQTDKQFAEKALDSALTQLETSRADANRQQKFIVVISKPNRPYEISFPQPLYHTLLVLCFSAILFGVLKLLLAVVRDYRN